MKKLFILTLIIFSISQNIIKADEQRKSIINEFNTYYKARKSIIDKNPNLKEDQILFLTGVELYKNNHINNALKRFMEVVYVHPQSSLAEEAVLFAARCYIDLKQYIFAEKELSLYLNKNANISRKDLFYLYRGICAKEEKRLTEADKFLTLVLENTNHNSVKEWAKRLLSLILLETGDRVRALKFVNELIPITPESEKQEKNRLLFLRNRIKWQYIMNYSLRDSSISYLHNEGSQTYILTYINGIAVFDRSLNKISIRYKKKDGLVSNLVRHIAIIGNEKWITTYSGLSLYNKETKDWKTIKGKNIPANMLKAVIFHQNRFWIGTLGKGLFCFDKKNNVWSNITLNDGATGNSVVDIKGDGSLIWIATLDGGVGYYNIEKKTWHNFTGIFGESAKQVKCIEVNEQYVFAGTFKQGLFVYDKKSGKWKNFTKANSALTSDNLLSMKIVNQKIYIGTYNEGVTVIDFQNNDWKWSKITVENGLPSMDITSIASENNYLWFGTINSGVGIMTIE